MNKEKSNLMNTTEVYYFLFVLLKVDTVQFYVVSLLRKDWIQFFVLRNTYNVHIHYENMRKVLPLESHLLIYEFIRKILTFIIFHCL